MSTLFHYAASQFPGLKVWVEKQRKRKRAKAISQEQIDLLDEIGFNWESTKAQWNDMFKKLQEYKEKVRQFWLDSNDLY